MIHIAEPGPYVIRTGFPMDLADEGPASEITTSFEPSVFEWEHSEEGPKDFFIRIRARTIFVSKDVYLQLRDIAEKRGLLEEDDYWVEFGVAKKAVAIRLSSEKGAGYKVRMIKGKNGSSQISCMAVIRKINKLCPSADKLDAVWDAKNKMFVAKLQGKGGKE